MLQWFGSRLEYQTKRKLEFSSSSQRWASSLQISAPWWCVNATRQHSCIVSCTRSLFVEIVYASLNIAHVRLELIQNGLWMDFMNFPPGVAHAHKHSIIQMTLSFGWAAYMFCTLTVCFNFCKDLHLQQVTHALHACQRYGLWSNILSNQIPCFAKESRMFL